MRKRTKEIIEYIGFVMMLLGFAGFGGNIILSAVIGFAGLAILYVSVKRECSHADRKSTWEHR